MAVSHTPSSKATMLLPAWLSIQLALPLPIPPPSVLWTNLPKVESQQDAALSKGRRRILQLADGRTLQVVARQRDGRWELRQGKDYQALPDGSVLSVRTESEVLKEWQAVQVPKAEADAVSSSAYVRRGFELGLTRQALDALDGLLGTYPVASEPVAIVAEFADSIRRPRLEFGTPSDDPALEEVAGWGASHGPVAAELAILELNRSDDRKALQGRLATWLEEGSPERRAFAAHGLRRLAPRAQPKPLMRRAVLDGSEKVREQAAFALAAAGDEALTLPIVRALNSSHPTVRSRAAQSLGWMGYPAAVPALVTRLAQAARGQGGGHGVPHQHIFIGTQSAYVQDFDVEVASGASIADPSVNTLVSGSVLDVGVRGIEIQQVLRAERRVLVSSLRQLTGADPGSRAKDWTSWYERNRSRFEGSSEGEQTRTPR